MTNKEMGKGPHGTPNENQVNIQVRDQQHHKDVTSYEFATIL